MFVLATGNVAEGIQLVGLFDSQQDAIDYAEKTRTNEWLVMPVKNVTGEDKTINPIVRLAVDDADEVGRTMLTIVSLFGINDDTDRYRRVADALIAFANDSDAIIREP